MPFNGSGVFTRIYSWVADRNANIKIRADRMDAEMNGFADGLSACITRDGQTTVTDDIPFNGKKLTGVGDATDDTDALNRQTGDARYLSPAEGDDRYPRGMLFGKLVHSRSASAETISVKTTAGTDPTTDSPVQFVFQDGTGGSVVRSVTAALSVTISSGSTMGATDAVPFRLWTVAADDGGTVRLGVVKTVSGTNIMPLVAWSAYSSTAEGGAGAADSAQVIYSTTAFTSKYICLVGFADWDSGLATAGTWGTAPTRVITYGPGVHSPGEPVQHRHTVLPGVFGSSTTGSYTDITGLSASLTPRSAANLVRATPRVQGATGVTGDACCFGLFRGAVNVGGGTAASNRVSAFAAWVRTSDANSCQTATAVIYDAPASTSAQTYQVKFCLQSGGVMAVNSTASDSDLAGIGRFSSSLTLEEIMA